MTDEQNGKRMVLKQQAEHEKRYKPLQISRLPASFSISTHDSANKISSVRPISLWSTFQLFVDKDTLLSAAGASHDVHLLRIDNREDELVTRVNKWVTELMKTVRRTKLVGPSKYTLSSLHCCYVSLFRRYKMMK